MEIIIPIIILIFDVTNLSFYIIVLTSFFIFGANLVLFYSEITKIYGILSGPGILSINSVFVGIVYLIMLCLKIYVLKENLHFNIVYILGGILSIGKFVLLLFLKEDVVSSLHNQKHDIRKIIDDIF